MLELILFLWGWWSAVSRGGNKAADIRESATIVAAGDIACDKDWAVSGTQCHQQATADLFWGSRRSIMPEAVLALGDLHYTNDQTDDMLGYIDSWGAAREITHPVIGNHEYRQSPGGVVYFNYWQNQAGNTGEGWYSWGINGWRMVAVNSNCDEVSCQKDGGQGEWLRRELAEARGGCSLVYMHHPRFSSGKSHGDNSSLAGLWEIFVEEGVDVVLAGHEHFYERLKPASGLRLFVAGTGGRSLYEFGDIKPFSERRVAAFGVLKMNLNRGSYSWEFLTEAGQVADQGSDNCQ